VVAKAYAIEVLYPSAIFAIGGSVQLSDDGTGPKITYWSPLLGPQPTQAELDSVTQEQVDTARLAKLRLQAKTLIDTSNDDSVERDKAIAFAAADGTNSLRAWLVDFKAAIAAAKSLDEIKAGVAALPNLPEVTKQQMLDGIKSKLS